MMIYHPGGIISFGSADAVLLHRATGGYKPGGGLPVHQGSGTHLTEAEDRHPNKFSGRFLQRSDRFRNLVQHIQMFEVPRQMFGAHDQMSGVRLRTNRPGHPLVIPYRHVADFFDAELAALLALLRDAKTLLDGRFHPDGYNIGVNVGEAAGQTVMHLHVHVIPRYAGDVADPRGGVRGAVPERRVY
jgi:diadenosine tetraphosphate (Ap4A) HIT family hydrolase